MLLKAFLIFVFVCFVKGSENFKIIDSIRQEQPCLMQGGTCTIAVDCPAGHLTEHRGLCPTQKSRGVECCYGISIKETRCEKHGGICVGADQYCNPQIVYNEATDCHNGCKCCILV